MYKTIFVAINLLMLFSPKISGTHLHPDSTQTNCLLPPPQTISFEGVTPSTISLSWTPVPNAALYRVSVYNQTDQVALPNAYTSSPFIELEELDTDSHEYLIGVSASACAGGIEFGAEIFIEYKPGIIIIVDEIVQRNCPVPPINLLPNPKHLEISLPFNSINNDLIETRRIRVSANDNQNSGYVDFLIWVDCYTQVRFCELEVQGATQIPSGKTIKYVFTDDASPFFEIINGACDINICKVYLQYYVPCLVGQGTCFIENDPASCGGRPDSDHLLLAGKDSSAVPIAANMNGMHKKNVEQPPSQPYLKVAPNPCSDIIDVQFHLDKPGPVSIQIFNATGSVALNLLSHQWLDSGAHSTKMTIGDTLNKGVYFLVLQHGDQRIVTPLIKI